MTGKSDQPTTRDRSSCQPAPFLNDAGELREFLLGSASLDVAVWDFDGVVVDSEPVHASAYRDVLASRGVSPPSGFFLPYTGQTERAIWTGLAEEYGELGNYQELRSERIRVVATQLFAAPPNWFVGVALAALEALGTRSVMVSSGNRETIDEYLQIWDLQQSFDSVSAASSGADVAPKAERLTALVAGKSGLLIEDSPQHISLAKRLGAVAIGVEHSYNVGADWHADVMLRAGV